MYVGRRKTHVTVDRQAIFSQAPFKSLTVRRDMVDVQNVIVEIRNANVIA